MIEFKNVSYSYGDGPLLSGVSFRLSRGSFTAIAGENGAGKSTLCRLAASLLKPSGGEILINGKSTSKERGAFFASFTGFLFQNPDRQICRSTVREEIIFGLDCVKADADLKNDVEKICEDFGLSLDQQIFTMSRGERQMLALASVLARRPEIIIADEPTSWLDGNQYALAAAKLREAQKNGAAVVIVTHDMELADELAENMMIIGDGTVKACAPAREIFRNSALMTNHSLCQPEIYKLAEILGSGFETADSVCAMEHLIKKMRKREWRYR